MRPWLARGYRWLPRLRVGRNLNLRAETAVEWTSLLRSVFLRLPTGYISPKCGSVYQPPARRELMSRVNCSLECEPG